MMDVLSGAPKQLFFSQNRSDAGVGGRIQYMLAEMWVSCHRNICTRPGLPGILTRKRQSQTNTNNAVAAPGSEGIGPAHCIYVNM